MRRALTIFAAVFAVVACVEAATRWAATRVLSIDYPVLALSAQVSGVVHFQVLLNNDGSVTGFQKASGARLLVEAAKEKVRYWQFSRDPESELPAPSTADITVIFKLVPESQRSTLTSFVYEYPGTAIVTGIAPHAEP